MKRLWILLIAAAVFGIEIPNQAPSTPEEIATHFSTEDHLVGGLVSPISGQISLRVADLIAKGAEPIVFDRLYLSSPPLFAALTGDKYMDYKAKKAVAEYYKFQFSGGFQCLRGLFIRRIEDRLHYYDPSGLTLQFSLDGKWLSDTYGITNVSGDTPSGKFDIRNIRMQISPNSISVFCSDGSERKYAYQLINGQWVYFLQKIILPNGKILRYELNPTNLLIRSLDPSEQFSYATVQIDWGEGSPKIYTNGGVDTANFVVESLFRRQDRFEGKVDKKNTRESYNFLMPPLMTSSSTPIYRHETIGYNSELQLTSFSGREKQFSLSYKDRSSQIEKVYFPIGENGTMIDLYTLAYDAPIAGHKGGRTVIQRKDGSRIEYFCNAELRMEKILYFGTDGVLKKQKQLEWDSQGRLLGFAWKDGDGQLFWGRKYSEYDVFGNPGRQVFYGDLSGEKKQEEWVTRKEYSQEGRNLLLKESTEDKTIVYTYVPNTNLPKTKFTKENETIVLREFWDYDACLNLIETIIDDGNTEEKENLSGVSERKRTQIRLRQTAPYLHMPEWVETYVGEEEKLLGKKKLEYDARGNVSEEHIYDSRGEYAFKIVKTYDEQGNLLTETNPLGDTSKSTYTVKGQLETHSPFSAKLSVKKSYDAGGRLKKTEETDLKTQRVHTTLYDYNVLDRCIKKTDPFHQETKYEYDSISGKQALIQGPRVENQEVKTIATYDGLGRKLTEEDPNKHITNRRYNAYASVAEILYPDGSCETFTYYRNGNLKTHVDLNGLKTEYKYDLFDRVILKTLKFEGEEIASETFVYDTFHLKGHTDFEKCITEYVYDDAGRKLQKIEHGKLTSKNEPRVTRYTYDSLGFLETVTHVDQYITKYERDFLGQILEETKMDLSGTLQARIGYEWDPDGKQIATIRYPHNTPAKETYLTDGFGRTTELRDALGFATKTIYEEGAVLKSITTDPNGIETIKEYDPYGRLSLLKIGAAYEEKKRYDPAGNLLEIEEGPHKVVYEYDSLNRVVSLTRGKDAGKKTDRYTYCSKGELKTKTLADQTVLSYTYTPLGYLRTVDASDDSIHQMFTTDLLGRLVDASDGKCQLRRTIDDFGNIESETVNGFAVKRTYDSLDRLTSIILPDASSIVYSYNALCPDKVERFSSELKEQYVHKYAAFDLMGNLLLEEPIYQLPDCTHTWNPLGQQKSISNPYFSQTIDYDPGSRVEKISSDGSYSYNDRSELTEESLKDGQMKYEYDSHQNRYRKNGVETSYNLLDELIGFEYDQRGNLKKNGHFRYRYDALNRLIEAESEKTFIRFTYDALDRCISKKTNGTEQYFLYKGMDELGSFTPSGTPHELKIPGLCRNPIAIELQGKVYAPIADYRGNIRRLISRYGHAEQSYDYTAFGEELTQNQDPFNPWRYSAKRYDPILQLSYFGKRFYDPFLGRWITMDPAGFIDGTNLYAYAHNNPLLYQDPDGRAAFVLALGTLSWGGGAGGAVAGGALLSNPVGWTICIAAVAATAIYAANKYVEKGNISSQAGEAISSVVGEATSSILNFGGMGDFYTGDLTPFSGNNSVGRSVYGNRYNMMFKNTEGVYVPDRPLPNTADGIHIPETDAPHTQLGTKDGRKGKYPQAREFDENGKPVRDIDFTDHGRPQNHPNPHQHDHLQNPTGGSLIRDPNGQPVEGWEYQ